MVSDALLYAGSAIITLWGIAHILPTESVVNGFGQISQDNKRIITMEWIAEGLAMCFIGILVLFVALFDEAESDVSVIVYGESAVMLVAMAVLTALTGARTSIVPIKICPFVKLALATLFILGSVL
jgi:hypothetical protein